MKMQVFSVFDKVSQAYGIPFFCPNNGVAKRMFCDLVRDESSVIYKHPSDFELYNLGEFDVDSGEFSCAAPLFVVKADSFVLEKE